ncbi:MAG: sigma-70 family RNA polymerase sigma factor [Candidatus Poribacteria bacterium]|nr:sigma-70 family RNA polymerase sigma factor [Candidatus Poribacteria bacterium]MDE0504416.1 sigma-70 family RNA polymerase sigma factor [Candidatus Poribacteria bacterium]
MYSADEKLVSQTLAGDRDAFGMLVHKYQDIVYSYAFQKVRNEADAQDITQEIFLQAYRCLYQLRQPHLYRSWLYTIMSNECKRWLERVTKNRRREVAIDDTADEALQVESAHTAPVEDRQVDLEQAMSALLDENRVAVAMFYMGDCSLKEISEFLGVSVNTVKGKLHRARQQLGAAMSQHYGKLLKSHKLRGGFLMQFMEHIRHVPAPAMGFTWSSASIGKSLFALITALCILIALVGGRENLAIESSINQTEVVPVSSNRWPIEVTLMTPAVNSAHTSISGIPVPTGKRPLDPSGRGPIEQSGRSIGREVTSAANGAKTPNPQFSAAMAENEPKKLTFSGRVVDSDGGPVADAEILYSAKYNQSDSVARTEDDGTFRFESPRLELKDWERVSVIATHPDHALGWRKLRLEDTVDVEIRLETPGVITGRILNEDGVPIQNAVARIQVLFSDNPALLGRDEGSLASDAIPISPATTDANGEFILRALPQGITTNLETHGPGYAKELHLRVSVGTTGLKWQLKREGRIADKLSYTGTGAPVEDATVALQGIYPTTGWGRAHVDAEGNYILTNLAPGFYNLYLYEGPEGWTAVAKEQIKVVKGQTVSNMDLTLVRGDFITGRVTDQDTSEPIVNHHVGFHDAARPESQAAGHGTETDETGAYRFRAAPGRARVFVSAAHGYLDVGQTRKHVDVVEGENVAVDFQFSKGAELAGRVLTEAGEPVAGVKITDMRERYKGYGRSNESGAFTVRGLRVGQKLTPKSGAYRTGITRNCRGQGPAEWVG